MRKHYSTLLPAAALAAFMAVACSDTATVPDLAKPDAAASVVQAVPLNPAHVGVTNSEFHEGECPTPPEGQEGWWGWHFIMPGNNNFTSLSVTFQNAGTFTADPFPGSVFVASPDNSHAYIWTPTDDVLLAGSATSDGENTFFNLSHVCYGDEGDRRSVEVTKTAFTEFTRTHNWDIDKYVSTENEYEHEGFPKVWLYTDGRGDETATWTVDVTYEGYTDSDWAVYGEIFIKNVSSDMSSKTITSIVDDLGAAGYEDVAVDCGLLTLPHTLLYDETLTCSYRVEAYPAASGTNTVTVGVDEDPLSPYTATEDWAFGDPTTVVNETVNVKDISDLFGEVALGTVTAPNGAQFTYTKDFAWEDFGAEGCGDFTYDNTATIVETGQDADATLKVNVQCYVWQSAWAQGTGEGVTAAPFCDNGFNNWGWSNLIGQPYEGSWPLYAGAGQCNVTKGTLVGYLDVSYNGGFSAVFSPAPGVLFEGGAVYAGAGMFPLLKNGNPTTGPGSYTVAATLAGNIYVIGHVNAGIPDPNFGP